MSRKARRLPERIDDIREAIGNARSDLPRLEALLDTIAISWKSLPGRCVAALQQLMHGIKHLILQAIISVLVWFSVERHT